MDGVRSQRVNPGLNFRPTEETVFKIDYQLNFEERSRTRVRNDALLFSVATYFQYRDSESTCAFRQTSRTCVEKTLRKAVVMPGQ
jgi:hypothetical protein